MADARKASVPSAASKSSSSGRSTSSGKSKDSGKPKKRKQSRASSVGSSHKTALVPFDSKTPPPEVPASPGPAKKPPQATSSNEKTALVPFEHKVPHSEVPAPPGPSEKPLHGTSSKEKPSVQPEAHQDNRRESTAALRRLSKKCIGANEHATVTQEPRTPPPNQPAAHIPSKESSKMTHSKEKEPTPPPKQPQAHSPSKEPSKTTHSKEQISTSMDLLHSLHKVSTGVTHALPRKSISAKGQYVEANEKAQEKTMHRGKVIMLIVVPALALLLALMAAVIYVITLERPQKRVDTCRSDDCAAFGRELRDAVNWSVDPCQDFHAFVCGGWSDPKRQETTESRMVAAALDLAINEAKADRMRRSKATQFFESCITAGKWKEENLREFADLRRSLGLLWPEQKPSNATHPLDIMVNLALNWEMNFLFDLSTVAVSNSTALFVSRGRLGTVWEDKLHGVRTIESYEDYVHDYYQVINANSSQAGVGAADLIGIEKAFVNAKLEFLYDTPRQDWFEVSALDGKTPSVPAGLWLALLIKHDKQFDWTGENTAIVEDDKIMQSIDKLLKGMDHEKLIIGLSWMFIQTHLWAVYEPPSLRFGGAVETLTKMKERGCMEYVESRLGLLGWATTLTERFGTTESRRHISSFLHRINRQTKRLINKLSWMDYDSKQMTFSKLDKMARTILPGDSFFDPKKRDQLYDVFPEMRGKTFMTNLVKASEVYRSLRNHEHFEDVYSVRMFPRFGRELYLYLPDSMMLALVNLSPPMYYKDATLAIQYGGLGSFAARQMTRAFDDIGVRVDDSGKRRLWLGAEAQAAHSIKVNCNVHAGSNSTVWRPMRALPTMPGLEIAYEGFLAAVKVDFRALDDFKVLHLEAFTDFQIFFLAYCYALCAKRPQTMRDECNVPAKNSPAFAEEFNCPANAPMNPPDKCSFFY